MIRELSTLSPDPNAEARVCVLYPNEYRGMASNLGIHIVCRLLRDEPGISVERSYLPTDAYEDLGPERRLVSLETGTELSRFDVVCVSLQFELDYPHVLEALIMGGVPPSREERDDDHPLIIAGGPCTVNPLPMEPYVDAFYVGEAEATFIEGIRRVLEAESRREALEELADVPGFYVPEHPEETERVAPRSLEDTDPPLIAFAPESPDLSGLRAYPVELSRGCPHACSFCLGGHTTGDWRCRPLDHLDRILRHAERSPYDRAALISATPTAHPDFEEVVELCSELGLELSLPSLRVDDLDPDLLPRLREAGVRTLTLAPESGSEEIREFLNKPIDEDHLLELVETAGRLGMRVRLYLIVGVPGFSVEEDALKSAQLVRECAERAEVSVSVNPLIPKAFTPLQYLPMLPIDEIRRRYRMFSREVSVEVSTERPELAHAQSLLSRGDRDVAPALERVLWRARSPRAWAKVLESMEPRIGPESPPEGPEEVPYDFIRVGPSHERLHAAYSRLAGLSAPQ
ncbi:MAG: B12-binding domain-containing radical SAM protein [Methanopyraceae archaeon]